jgi:hypothetical protein
LPVPPDRNPLQVRHDEAAKRRALSLAHAAFGEIEYNDFSLFDGLLKHEG